MPLYDVYGVGNALVDLEYEIPESTLQDLNVDKGLMTLIEEDRHHELLDNLYHIESHPCGGGSAANTMVAIAQLGAKPYYSCKVADDPTGHFFLDDLISIGVSTNLNKENLAEGHTGKCIVLISPDAQRSMNTYLGITRELSVAELDEEALRDSAYVYIEGYLVPEVNARAAAVRAREVAEAAGVKTSLTLSDVNMVNFFKDELLEIIGNGLDMIFANEDEAMLMFDVTDLAGCIDGMRQCAAQFAITRGKHGAVLFDGETLYEISAETVNAVDSTGAGDIYAGSFLYGLSQGMHFKQCGELAGKAATELVQHLGARLSKEQLQAIGNRFA